MSVIPVEILFWALILLIGVALEWAYASVGRCPSDQFSRSNDVPRTRLLNVDHFLPFFLAGGSFLRPVGTDGCRR
ncbi:MAG: hypothetical protein CMJ65_00535 [Planctomycetaceae bacterium]|jgi:hypothetical protein|nr:hypothetical protein [Planctomycetaceae bacterium]